jgi:hypothetical protein
MADKDSLTEESKWLIELLRLLWVTLLAIGGGTVGLILVLRQCEDEGLSLRAQRGNLWGDTS